jgi:hypothetical protein
VLAIRPVVSAPDAGGRLNELIYRAVVFCCVGLSAMILVSLCGAFWIDCSPVVLVPVLSFLNPDTDYGLHRLLARWVRLAFDNRLALGLAAGAPLAVPALFRRTRRSLSGLALAPIAALVAFVMAYVLAD